MLLLTLMAVTPPAPMDWPAYGRDAGGTRYVDETHLTKTNVAKLAKAWEFHTGDVSDMANKPSSAFECTPLYVDGTLYVVSPFNRVFALDPDSGKAKWTFDPEIQIERPAAV